MSDLLEKIQLDLKDALKSKDSLKVSVIRMLLTFIKNKEISSKDKISDQELLKIIKNEIKKRKDSINNFLKGNRTDLADKERSEIEILQLYSGPEMTEEEVRIRIKSFLESNSDLEKNFGKIMGLLIREFQGQADGTLISKILKEEL